VVHAGIYYPPGSLKARLCTRGREALYGHCERSGVPHRRCGKLIVATSEAELEALAGIRAVSERNGVELEPLSGAAACALEPQLKCVAALRSAATGIVDAHSLMLSYLGAAQAHGAEFAFRSRVTRMQLDSAGVRIDVNGEPAVLMARLVINCAGLAAPALARSTAGFPRRHIPREFLAKGSYFTLTGKAPFRHLIYPIPVPGGLGIHLTLDLAGRARFGPDVQWVEQLDFDVDPARAPSFYRAVRRYWPGLPDGALGAGYAGVRPKISAPSEAPADFRIDGPQLHGTPMVHLFGIESPGLTASLAIGAHVAALAGVG
jgi:L-2-hydroxyglutarate oxidase LhgO